MRIIAGTAKGRPLATPKNDAVIRPTSDRVRETLFNVLGQFFEESIAVLDLFAGTGALAFEALSRGAGSAVLVDRDKEALSLCRENAQSLQFIDKVEILAGDVERTIESLGKKGRKFSLIFADPPYALHAGQSVLMALESSGICFDGCVVVYEHEKRESLAETIGGWRRSDQRRFGDTMMSFYQLGT